MPRDVASCSAGARSVALVQHALRRLYSRTRNPTRQPSIIRSAFTHACVFTARGGCVSVENRRCMPLAAH